MAENLTGDDSSAEIPRPEKQPTIAPVAENAAGADVCAPAEIIRSDTSHADRLGVQEVNGVSDFSVITQYDGSDPRRLSVASSYEGPLPPPGYLKGYEETVPGSAKQIISWVKHESDHRRRIELAEFEHRRQLEVEESKHRRILETRAMDLGEKALASGISRANLGMYLSWPVMVLVILFGSLLVHSGHDKAGTIIVTAALTLMGSIYALNKYEKLRGQQDKPGGDGRDEPKDPDGKE